MWKRSLACGLVALGSVTLPAHAADMPLFPQPSYQDAEPAPQFEFGSGWYLRGDLTASDDREPNVLGTFGKDDDHDWGYGAGVGAGYKFNQYFRADVTGDYLSTQKHVGHLDVDYPFGTIDYTVKSNLRRYDGLLNAYFDLGSWSGLTPYIGAGVGFAGLRTDGSISYYIDPLDNGYAKIKGHTDYNLAWAAMAGFAYSLTPNLMLDVGYRFLDLGTYQAPEPLYSLNPGKKTDLTSHEVRVGVRYMLY